MRYAAPRGTSRHFLSVSVAPLLVAAVSVGTFACTAHGAPAVETEPNDNVLLMTGPVPPDGLTGSIGTQDDVDQFLLQMRPQRQVKVRMEILDSSTCDLSSILLGRVTYEFAPPNGRLFLVKGDLGGPLADRRSAEHFFTTPGTFGGPTVPVRLIVGGNGSPESIGCNYRFSLTSVDGSASDALDPTPPPAYPTVTVREPDDLPSQATRIGPDTYYTGAKETEQDVDNLVAVMRPGRRATIEYANVGYSVSYSANSSSGASLAGESGFSEGLSLNEFTVPADGIVRIKVDAVYPNSSVGGRWRLRVTPASAFPTPAARRPALSLLRLGTEGRRLKVRVRTSGSGNLVVRLVRRGTTRAIPVTRLRVRSAREVAVNWRVPSRVRGGRFAAIVFFRPDTGTAKEFRRAVTLR